MSAASQRRAATRRVCVARAWRIAAIAAACLPAGVIAACGGDGHRPTPAPTPSNVYSLHATARDGAPADEPAAAAGATVTAPSGPTGRGALARRLPVRFRGWQLSIAQLSPRHAAYLVTALPPPGRRATLATAARLLRAAARALGDDPGAYRPLLPMSALAAAHRGSGAASQVRAGSAAE